jgi:VanZ family protein
MMLKRLPTPAIMLTLWLLSSRPLHLPETGITGLDKAAHFIAYAILALAIALWPGEKRWKSRPFWTALLVVFLTALYGAVDEVHQSFVPGRDASVFDWAADVVGAVAGTWALVYWRKHTS